MKWALVPKQDDNNSSVKYGINSPIKPTDIAPLDRMVFYDLQGKECCSRYWIEGPMTPLNPLENKSIFMKSKERDCCCENLVCSLSHQLPILPYHFIKSFRATIDYQGTLLSICRLFGDEFIWKKEPYIQRLFEALADKCNVEHRHDPMTRNNEVIREIIPTLEK